MKVTTAAQMQAIDRFTINEIGIQGVVLMENAGAGVARVILDRYEDAQKITIVCGKGNNGGDGFVVSRHLFNQGRDIKVIIVGDIEKINGDAKVNLDIIEKMGLTIVQIKDGEELSKLRMKLLHTHLIVDALFGTGLDSPVRGIYGEAIDLINEIDVPVVSVDLPSGLCADHGRILGSTIKADCTITFGLPKRCHYLYPAAAHVGELEIIDISLPKNLKLIEDIKTEYIDNVDITTYLPPRLRDSHKGSFGHVLVLGGSPGKTGAPIMAAEAAQRCGAGLVTCGIPKSLNPILETQLLEAMTLSLSETSEKTLDYKCIEEIYGFIEDRKITCIAIGPGISTNEETGKLVIEMIKKDEIPMVIDADALNLLSREESLDFLTYINSPRILTPHPGEMARLIKKDVRYIRDNPIEAAEDFAQKYNVILVLKGAPTIIASPDGRVFINSTGNPGLAKGGSGDVLTGMVAALICQVKDPLKASILGVYLHGLAADLASKNIAEVSLVASDVIEYIPEALAYLAS